MKNLISSVLLSSFLLLGHHVFSETFVKEFPLKSGVQMSLLSKVGIDVVINGWEKEVAQIRVKTESPLDRYDFKFNSKAKNLLIQADYQGAWTPDLGAVEVEIMVPSKINLSIDLRGGSVYLQGLEGNHQGITLGGALTFSDLQGNLQFQTMGGDVLVKNSQLDGQVSTRGGEISFLNVSGDIKSVNESGNMQYITEKSNITETDQDALVIEKMGGDIRLDRAPNGAELSTRGGDIVIGNVERYVIASTNGGNIEIQSANGSVEATTNSGNINVRMVGDSRSGNRDVRLLSEYGDIELIVPENLEFELSIETAISPDETDKGKIFCSFPVEIDASDEFDNRRGYPLKYTTAKASIGRGKHKLIITTVNGNVSVVQDKER